MEFQNSFSHNGGIMLMSRARMVSLTQPEVMPENFNKTQWAPSQHAVYYILFFHSLIKTIDIKTHGIETMSFTSLPL